MSEPSHKLIDASGGGCGPLSPNVLARLIRQVDFFHSFARVLIATSQKHNDSITEKICRTSGNGIYLIKAYAAE